MLSSRPVLGPRTACSQSLGWNSSLRVRCISFKPMLARRIGGETSASDSPKKAQPYVGLTEEDPVTGFFAIRYMDPALETSSPDMKIHVLYDLDSLGPDFVPPVQLLEALKGVLGQVGEVTAITCFGQHSTFQKRATKVRTTPPPVPKSERKAKGKPKDSQVEREVTQAPVGKLLEGSGGKINLITSEAPDSPASVQTYASMVKEVQKLLSMYGQSPVRGGQASFGLSRGGREGAGVPVGSDLGPREPWGGKGQGQGQEQRGGSEGGRGHHASHFASGAGREGVGGRGGDGKPQGRTGLCIVSDDRGFDRWLRKAKEAGLVSMRVCGENLLVRKRPVSSPSTSTSSSQLPPLKEVAMGGNDSSKAGRGNGNTIQDPLNEKQQASTVTAEGVLLEGIEQGEVDNDNRTSEVKEVERTKLKKPFHSALLDSGLRGCVSLSGKLMLSHLPEQHLSKLRCRGQLEGAQVVVDYRAVQAIGVGLVSRAGHLIKEEGVHIQEEPEEDFQQREAAYYKRMAQQFDDQCWWLDADADASKWGMHFTHWLHNQSDDGAGNEEERRFMRPSPPPTRRVKRIKLTTGRSW